MLFATSNNLNNSSAQLAIYFTHRSPLIKGDQFKYFRL